MDGCIFYGCQIDAFPSQNSVCQWYSNLAHEIHFPVELSSNPDQTHLLVHFLMVLKTLISMLRCVCLDLNSAGKWILQSDLSIPGVCHLQVSYWTILTSQTLTLDLFLLYNFISILEHWFYVTLVLSFTLSCIKYRTVVNRAISSFWLRIRESLRSNYFSVGVWSAFHMWKNHTHSWWMR